MFVKPSNTTPAALRKARWEAEQKRKNADGLAAVVKATVKK